MREINFRGKRIDNGEWVYGYYAYCTDGEKMSHRIYTSFAESYGKELLHPLWFSIKPETVGQYTGLKDKNGKEIYEGDILIKYDSTKRFVGYKNASFTYTNIPELDQTHNTFSMFYTEFINPISKEWEVIGNIYENPELL